MEYTQLQMGLKYARLGWHVLPLHNINNGCSCGKACKSPGKHPRTQNGVKDATTDEDQIKEWWSKWPEANIGIATGSVSGILVIDVDPRNGGDKSLNSLWRQFGLFPETVSAKTGGDGRHFYFNYPIETIKNSKSKLGSGLDIKTTGGYVVAAPSNHISGGAYEWDESFSPDEVDVADLPEWVVKLLGAEKKEPPKLCGSNQIPKGERNTTLISLAGGMRAKGSNRMQIEVNLLEINEKSCIPPLDNNEIHKIALSASRYKKGKTTPVHIWKDLLRSEAGPEGEEGRGIRHLLINLSFYMDDYGNNCYPTQDQQAIETGYSPKHVSKVLKKAEKIGWIISRVYKVAGQGWRNKIYRPCIPKEVVSSERHLIETYCPEAMDMLSSGGTKHN